jgi:hypothetical protein
VLFASFWLQKEDFPLLSLFPDFWSASFWRGGLDRHAAQWPLTMTGVLGRRASSGVDGKGAGVGRHGRQTNKSFFGSFFSKKELLPCLT